MDLMSYKYNMELKLALLWNDAMLAKCDTESILNMALARVFD